MSTNKAEWIKLHSEWRDVEDKLTTMVGDTGNEKMMDTLLDWMNIRNKLNQGYVDYMEELTKNLPSPIFTGKELQLASHFMGMAKDEFGNHGCNDVEEYLWKDWTIEERQKFVKEYHDYNGSPKEYDPDNLDLPDFAIMGFFSKKLKQQAERFNSK